MRKIEIRNQDSDVLSFNKNSSFKDFVFILKNFPKMDWIFSSWIEKIILVLLFLWGVYGFWLLFLFFKGLT